MAEPVAFDPTTAKADSGFNPATARPDAPAAVTQQSPSFLDSIAINAGAPELRTQYRSLIQNSEMGSGSGNPLTAGITKSVAGVLGLPIQTLQNIVNLSRATTGSIAGALGFTDMMPSADVQLPGNVESATRALGALGLNTKNARPNDPVYRGLEIAGENAAALAMPGATLGQTALSTAGQIAGEQVAGPEGRMIGGMLPAVASATYAAAREGSLQRQQQANAQKDATARTAREEGYTLPPTETNPTNWMNKLLEGTAGKLTTRQMASARNSEVTTNLAKRSLGIPENGQITEAGLQSLRSQAGQAYEAVKQFGASNNLRMRTDPAFQRDIKNLGGDINAAIKEFPDLVKVPEIEALQTSLNVKNMTPTAAVELSKSLRAQASDNARAMARGDPQARALMSAQRQAADAVEGLIERTLQRSGQAALLKDYKNARTIIARSHDVEAALNPATGTIDPRILSRLDDKRPLGGGLDVAANTYKAFPKAMQTPESIGSQPGISPLDFAMSTGLGIGGTAAFGAPGAAAMAAPFIRPIARAGILTRPYQQSLGTPSYDPMLSPDSGLAALMRGYLSGNMTQ